MIKDSDKKILITGGAGYIGSVLCGVLLNEGHKIRILDNFTFGKNSIVQLRDNPDFELIEGDLTDTETIKKALHNIKTVVHLAAIVGDPACRINPKLAERVNKTASEQLYQLANDFSVDKFIFASTCSNYGKMTDSDGMVDESSQLNPISHYAELKVGFEKYLLDYQNGITEPVILRFSTAYGLSRRMRFDLTVNEFTKDLYHDKILEVYGEQFWRPYCHTMDLSRAVLKVINSDSALVAKEAFNVGGNEENYRKKTIVEILLKYLADKAKNVKYVKKDEDPRDYRVRFDKIKRVLNYELTKAVDDGIRELIDAFSNNKFESPDKNIYRNS